LRNKTTATKLKILQLTNINRKLENGADFELQWRILKKEVDRPGED
jgi:hypothetical protein